MHGQVLRNSLFKFVALALLVLMSPAACVTESPVAERVIAVGERVPEFSVILDNGEEWASHNSGGLPSVIAFFHTGCGDCRSELPELQEACRQSGDRVRFVCIAREEDAADIAAWWSDNGLSLPWSAQPRLQHVRQHRHTADFHHFRRSEDCGGFRSGGCSLCNPDPQLSRKIYINIKNQRTDRLVIP